MSCFKLKLECDQDYFKESIGNSECSSCPANSETNSDGSSCVCSIGYFRDSGLCKGIFFF